MCVAAEPLRTCSHGRQRRSLGSLTKHAGKKLCFQFQLASRGAKEIAAAAEPGKDLRTECVSVCVCVSVNAAGGHSPQEQERELERWAAPGDVEGTLEDRGSKVARQEICTDCQLGCSQELSAKVAATGPP